ncbi:MAG: HNH endonuclease signature motif containing protein [Microscillaceae bacterium]|nr:HNH endonuclease signature motif containing protein [Microscillaceae bacterium]
MSPKKLKVLIYERADGLCEYCKSPANISSQAFVVEHIIPQSKGGKTILENLALSCQGCNSYKYNKTNGIDSITSEETKLFNPREQKWEDNFFWSADVVDILGKTSAGRVTVDILRLNRPELRNLRQLLAEVGKHPPK